MARQLWRPATESDGIPVDVLMSIMNHLNEWKDEHLARVGVPSNFHAEWDFVSAVTACECFFRFIYSFLFPSYSFLLPWLFWALEWSLVPCFSSRFDLVL